MQNVFLIIGTLLKVNGTEGTMEIDTPNQVLKNHLTVHGLDGKFEPGAELALEGKFATAIDEAGRPMTQLQVTEARKAKKGAQHMTRGRIHGIMWDRGTVYYDEIEDRQPFAFGMVDIGKDRAMFAAFNPLARKLMYGDPKSKNLKIEAGPMAEILIEGSINQREFGRWDGTVASGPRIRAEEYFCKVLKAGTMPDYFGDKGTLEAEGKKAAAI